MKLTDFFLWEIRSNGQLCFLHAFFCVSQIFHHEHTLFLSLGRRITISRLVFYHWICAVGVLPFPPHTHPYSEGLLTSTSTSTSRPFLISSFPGSRRACGTGSCSCGWAGHACLCVSLHFCSPWWLAPLSSWLQTMRSQRVGSLFHFHFSNSQPVRDTQQACNGSVSGFSLSLVVSKGPGERVIGKTFCVGRRKIKEYYVALG